MESRFRIRFWSTRRSKRNPAELDLHSVPYQTAPPDHKQPVFIHQSLGRNLSERRKSQQTSPLRAFSYRQAKPGKLPVVGGRPHKGNGPVKLQTSRRLSSGELLVTSQDSRETLEEIREGEYIVGAKGRRDSRAYSVRSSSTPQPQQRLSLRSPSANSFSPDPMHLSSQPGWGSFPGSTALLDIPEHAVDPSLTPLSVQSAPNPTDRSLRRSPSASPVEGLGLSGTSLEPPAGPQGILKSSGNSAISLLEPHEEQNATIRALWKAEYGRLVSMYGQAGVDRNIAELRRNNSTSIEEQPPSFLLEPLPQPGWEVRDSPSAPKSSRNSRSESTPHEDISDESSQQRLSFMSSAGYASSYTTRTSVADTESINARDDIRKMVDDMRSTYLKAIESREPSLEAVKSLKKKKTTKKSTAAGTLRASSAVSPSTPLAEPSTPEPHEKRSVSAQNPSPVLHSERSTRNFSSPVGGISKLPAIEASPSRDREPEPGLKRADSSTLGALMGEHKRSSIQKRKSKRKSRRSSVQRHSPPNLSPNKAVSQENTENAEEKDMTVLDAEFRNLYQDIFRTSTDDFWQSNASFSPTMGLLSKVPSPDRPPPPVPT
jgi:hypothetical protein